MNKFRNVIILVTFFVTLALVSTYLGNGIQQKVIELPYSDLVKNVKQGRITNVVLSNSHDRIRGKIVDGRRFITVAPFGDRQFITTLLENNVNVHVESGESTFGVILHHILSWLPFLFIVAIAILFSRKMPGGKGSIGSGPLAFNRASSRMMQEKKVNITFDDVAGIDEAKAELEEIVEFLKKPEKFRRLGGKIPRGVLLVGAPGNGKTLLAKAIAGEAGVPFYSISGSEFIEVFAGVGASRVREMFNHSKKNAPCIVFIDEIDAVGRQRDSVLRGGNDEREQTLNQLLVEMDGFEPSSGVIVLAATNRPDILDHALLRPGRFDRKIMVQYPDMSGREKILRVHSKNVPLADDVDLLTVARGTPGFSGAELANLVNEAALIAAKNNKLAVSMQDLEMAKDKVLMGSERKSMIMTDEDKKFTAYHEAGHALIAILTPSSDPVHKVTIIPRGAALGMVMRLPEKDKVSVSKEELLGDIKVAMGGRAAEALVFGEDKVTTGASQDIKNATAIARNMVTKWGMSYKVGVRTFDFDSGYFDRMDNVSDKTSQIIDAEIKAIMDSCYTVVEEMLVKNRDKLDRIVELLVKYETLTGDEVRKICNGEDIVKNEKTRPPLNYTIGGLPESE